MASRFTIDTSKFKSGKHFDRKVENAIRGVMRYWDGPAEKYMKTRAPWTDRTGNARNGLAAEYFTRGKGNHGILMRHSMSYGIYLETRNSGRYAIIMPTVRYIGPKVLKTLTKLLDRLDERTGGGE